MSEKQKSNLDIDQQGLQEPSTSADDITKLLAQDRYDAAYSRMKDPETGHMSNGDLEAVEGAADKKVREISPDMMPQGALSLADTEKGIESAGDSKLNEFGAEHNQEFKQTFDLYNETMETDKILLELREAIRKAKEEAVKSKIAKPVGLLAAPVFGSIWGIFKGKRFKENMAKISELSERLKENPATDRKLQMDKISPNKGHWSTLTAEGLGVGSLAFPPLIFGAAAAGIVAIFRTISGYSSMKEAAASLDDLDKNVSEGMQKNSDLKSQLYVHMAAYRTGAKENISGLMAA